MEGRARGVEGTVPLSPRGSAGELVGRGRAPVAVAPGEQEEKATGWVGGLARVGRSSGGRGLRPFYFIFAFVFLLELFCFLLFPESKIVL